MRGKPMPTKRKAAKKVTKRRPAPAKSAKTRKKMAGTKKSKAMAKKAMTKSPKARPRVVKKAVAPKVLPGPAETSLAAGADVIAPEVLGLSGR
jgi:hypothetical protein